MGALIGSPVWLMFCCLVSDLFTNQFAGSGPASGRNVAVVGTTFTQFPASAADELPYYGEFPAGRQFPASDSLQWIDFSRQFCRELQLLQCPET
jgi:hypothetical protein